MRHLIKALKLCVHVYSFLAILAVWVGTLGLSAGNVGPPFWARETAMMFDTGDNVA